MSTSLWAGTWGLVAGSALLVGALIGVFAKLPQRLLASVMAFGGGVLISALSFELIQGAYQQGGLTATAIGFLAGAGIYTLANYALTKHGAKHRKRSGDKQAAETQSTSGLAIAVGSLLDGIPESIAIGLSMLAGGAVSMVAVIAIFVSNIPEGLSSSTGMRKAGRSRVYIFGVWAFIMVASGLAALAGYAVFSRFSPGVDAATTAVAAGAILAMLADTMMPEAFEEGHNIVGLVTVLGFLVAFFLSKAET